MADNQNTAGCLDKLAIFEMLLTSFQLKAKNITNNAYFARVRADYFENL